MNRLAITNVTIQEKEYTAYIALDEKREFVDFQLFELEEHSLMDRIYIGRVERVLPNIQAVFVRITPEQTCYLPLPEAQNGFFTRKQSKNKPICQGDELLVQVTKDAVRTKDPVVSTNLTFTGSYTVLTTGNKEIGISKKLPEEQRTERKALLDSICHGHEEMGYGVVLRTNSAQASEDEICADVKKLVNRFRTLVDSSLHRSAYTELYRNTPGYIRRLQALRNFSQRTSDRIPKEDSQSVADSHIADSNAAKEDPSGYDGIYTDVPGIYEQISHSLPYLEKQGILHLYEDPQVSLATLYHINGNVEKLLSKKVWLPSGANLIIERVEAMTVIDVNSAKNGKLPKGDSAKEQMILKVNKEAARECARQLRLRNISGIIIIDFINMKEKNSQQELVRFLKQELKQDTVPCCFVDITALGLVELTRKKVQKSLYDQIGNF